jgi:choline dehydrogenase
VRQRSNLRLETNAHVRRIHITDGRATGLTYQQGDTTHEVQAREIILAGGAINSPQLLMLSGVGDGADLTEHGIPVVHHLPGVGRNLQDHVYAHYLSRVDPVYSINKVILNAASARTSWRLLPQVLQFAINRTGILTSAAAQVVAFARSNSEVETPDLQIQFRPFSMIITKEGKFVAEDHPAVTASVSYIRPRSRGQITLGSTDPFAAPNIQFNYLTAQDDMRAMIEGIRVIRRIFAAQPMAEHVVSEATPGVAAQSDEELAAYLRQYAQAMYHPVGSCRMGGDMNAVVDARLRVHGIDGLRVIDASVMPSIVSGNTNAPTIMIAEKGADMVREDSRLALAA